MTAPFQVKFMLLFFRSTARATNASSRSKQPKQAQALASVEESSPQGTVHLHGGQRAGNGQRIFSKHGMYGLVGRHHVLEADGAL